MGNRAPPGQPSGPLAPLPHRLIAPLPPSSLTGPTGPSPPGRGGKFNRNGGEFNRNRGPFPPGGAGFRPSTVSEVFQLFPPGPGAQGLMGPGGTGRRVFHSSFCVPGVCVPSPRPGHLASVPGQLLEMPEYPYPIPFPSDPRGPGLPVRGGNCLLINYPRGSSIRCRTECCTTGEGGATGPPDLLRPWAPGPGG